MTTATGRREKGGALGIGQQSIAVPGASGEVGCALLARETVKNGGSGIVAIIRARQRKTVARTKAAERRRKWKQAQMVLPL